MVIRQVLVKDRYHPASTLLLLPMASLYMFYGGDTKMYIDDITLIPVKEALVGLPQLIGTGEAIDR